MRTHMLLRLLVRAPDWLIVATGVFAVFVLAIADGYNDWRSGAEKPSTSMAAQPPPPATPVPSAPNRAAAQAAPVQPGAGRVYVQDGNLRNDTGVCISVFADGNPVGHLGPYGTTEIASLQGKKVQYFLLDGPECPSGGGPTPPVSAGTATPSLSPSSQPTGEAFTLYEFPLAWQGGKVSLADAYRISSGDAPLLAPGRRSLVILSEAKQELHRYRFDPQLLASGGRFSLLVPHEYRGAIARVLDPSESEVVTVDLRASRVCNDDSVCRADAGETETNCPTDCARGGLKVDPALNRVR